jgi:predicted ATP-binding protein involved in virulence
MKLKTLEIKNFRCFESLSMDLDEQLTVLVAENGVGKTAILDAITVAISPFVGGFDTGTGKGFKPEDARLKVADKLLRNGKYLMIQGVHRVSEMESQYPISLTAVGIINEHFEQWSRELTGKKTQTTFGKARVLIDYAKTLQQQVRAGEPVTLPIIAYYGTGRLLKQGNTSRKSSTESRSRLYGYHDALNPNSNYKTFEKWFIEESFAELRLEAKKNLDLLDELKKESTRWMSPHIPKRLLNNEDDNSLDVIPVCTTKLKYIRKAINQCLFISGWNTLEYEFNQRELIVSNNKNFHFMPVAQLSDGVKSMLSLTADIAYRCVQLNPHLTSPTEETNGIVLIDEIDLHLHPKWQQTVLSDLQKAFPKIQFIVTTHSPQVLTSVKAECIRELSADYKVLIPSINTYGEESKVVLEDLMHVSSRPPTEDNELLQNYLKRINHGDIDSSEVVQWRQTLEKAFGSEYSKLKLADMVINKWKAKQGIL